VQLKHDPSVTQNSVLTYCGYDGMSYFSLFIRAEYKRSTTVGRWCLPANGTQTNWNM